MEIVHPVLGKFSIIKQIGSGSFASVYLARHHSLEYLVAVKIFQNGFMEEYVKNSFTIAKSIVHPFICQDFDLFKNQKGDTCVLMEYVEGMTLLDYANLNSPFSEYEIQSIFGQLIIATEHLHKNHIIHRDLKCENIMIDNFKNIRLIDFGFSCSNCDMHSTACGSPAYLAPEIIQSDNYGISVDIWSLGIILYAIKFGQLPFENQSFSKLFHMITSEDPYFPEDEKISENLLDLIKKLLIKQPEKRITIDEIKLHPFFTTDSTGSNYFFDQSPLNIFVRNPLEPINPEIQILRQMILDEKRESKAIENIKNNNNMSYDLLTYKILFKNYVSTQQLPNYYRCFLHPFRLNNRSNCKAVSTTGDLPYLLSIETIKSSQKKTGGVNCNSPSKVEIEKCGGQSLSIGKEIPKMSHSAVDSSIIFGSSQTHFNGSTVFFNPTLKVRHFSSNSGPLGNDSPVLRFSPVVKKNVLNFKTLSLASQMGPNMSCKSQKFQPGSLPAMKVLPNININEFK